MQGESNPFAEAIVYRFIKKDWIQQTDFHRQVSGLERTLQMQSGKGKVLHCLLMFSQYGRPETSSRYKTNQSIPVAVLVVGLFENDDEIVAFQY